jgi:hypothetical protein
MGMTSGWAAAKGRPGVSGPPGGVSVLWCGVRSPLSICAGPSLVRIGCRSGVAASVGGNVAAGEQAQDQLDEVEVVGSVGPHRQC